MTVKSRFRVLAAILVLAAVTAACGASPAPSQAGLSGATVKIGFIGPLSGLQAETGNIYAAGAQAAVAYVNNHGGIMGHPLQVVTVDSAGNASQTSALTRLLMSEGVVGLVGDVGSGVALAEMAVVNASDNPIPAFVGASADSVFVVSQSPWSFTAGYVSSLISQSYVDYLVKTRGFKKIGIIYEDTAYGHSQLPPTTTLLTAAGLTAVSSQAFPSGATDVTVQLRRLQDAGADGVLVFTFGANLITVLKGLNAIGWHPPAVTSISVAQQGNRDAVGLAGLANIYGGPIATNLLSTSATQPAGGVTGDFVTAFKKARNEDQLNGDQLSGAVAFDDTLILAAAMNQAKSTDATKIRAALESGMSITGAQGNYQFSPTNHVGLPYSEYGMFSADVVCVAVCQIAPKS